MPNYITSGQATSPILNCNKRFGLGDVIHQYEAHSATIVGGRNRTISLLSCSVPYLQLEESIVPHNCLHFEVDSDRCLVVSGKRAVAIAEEERCLADARVSNDQQLEHVVELLVVGHV